MTVQVSSKWLASPKSITCIGGGAKSVVPENKDGWWSIPICGATEYRWKAR
jgi:hypothetical protein